MKSILILTDFSAAARCAAEQALAIAAELSAEIWLVNVYPITPYLPPVGMAVLPTTTADQKRRESMGKLNREARRLQHFSRQDGRSTIRPIALEGQLAERTAGLARRKKSVLIMMGASDKAQGDFLFSSKIKAVLQEVRCPILAIPANWSRPRIRHILFATSLTVEDELVIGKLVDFSARLNARLTVGHVSRPVLIPDFLEESRNSTFSEKIKNLYPAIRYTNPRASNIRDGLEKISAEKQVDVIALRYHKQPFWYHLFHKNPLKELIEQGNRPLLIFPENSVRHG